MSKTGINIWQVWTNSRYSSGWPAVNQGKIRCDKQLLAVAAKPEKGREYGGAVMASTRHQSENISRKISFVAQELTLPSI
ncbi:hypothetical protein V8J88_23015 [Massilia sp. W12]|uniref:hypothetical protein n=1 Tax=Massilia sp. W12 TaxID=3126507 RepID=UPI0030D42456